MHLLLGVLGHGVESAAVLEPLDLALVECVRELDIESLASISGHLGEVQSTIQTTGKARHIDVECDLLVLKVERLVMVRVIQEVDTRTDVCRVWTVGDETKGERIAGCGDTVCSAVVSTVDGTVGRASGWVWAKRRVPGVSSVAVLRD